MSFEEEWNDLKQAALERRTAMRLNQLAPAGGGGGAPDLKSAPAKKRKFAETIEKDLVKPTREAGDTVDATMTAAARAFEGWDTAAGLKKSHEKWEDQVTRLVGRLSTNATQLRGAAKDLLNTDLDVGQGLQTPKSKLTGL
ncbi:MULTISPECIES: hypothetical protein [Streptomyces]|uniref:Excreted virulence factor EspC, type VII ESX diderm n=1 Tax=Streptomyces sudanensis TaxID=436397 RepID=A0ABY4TCW5_9ACTN|nr:MULTISPECIES: hypothetical protein [Streptomyces]MCP9958817.1 hypothetical protein [Streptomyces sudanensis]MCQ0000702.1 hypothetical protein [Streptomyces sudanensis]URN16286.1 hypothetical protein MW084_10355 [Streptomyces sudanensis]